MALTNAPSILAKTTESAPEAKSIKGGVKEKNLSDQAKILENKIILLADAQANQQTAYKKMDEANQLFQKHEIKTYKLAIQLYEEAKGLLNPSDQNITTLDKNIVGAYNNILMILQKDNKYEEMIQVGTEALTKYPNNPTILYLMVIAYFNSKQYLKAVEGLTTLLTVDQAKEAKYNELLAKSYENIALNAFDAKKYKEASASLETAITFYQKINNSEGITRCTTNRNIAYFNLAVEAYNSNNYAEAITNLNKLIPLESDPSKIDKYKDLRLEAYISFLTTLNEAKNYTVAITVANQALELYKNNPNILQKLAYAYRESDNYTKAHETYDLLIKIDPDHAGWYWNGKGETYMREGKTSDGFDAFNKGMALPGGSKTYTVEGGSSISVGENGEVLVNGKPIDKSKKAKEKK